MRWGSAVSRHAATGEALAEAVAESAARLRGRADLAILFVTPHHAARYDALPAWVLDALPGVTVLGCSAAGVIGDGREIEDAPGLSLTLAELPDVSVRPFHLDPDDVPTTDGAWHRALGVTPAEAPQVLLLADPFGFDPAALASLDRALPASPKVGGLASGMTGPGEGALFVGATTRHTGAVGVALTGDVVVEPVVAQGCRPIGQPMFVTGVHGNVLTELDGRPPLPLLVALYESLDGPDRALFQHSLFLGVQMREQPEYGAGDFLVRNVLGVDQQRGWISVGARLARYDVVQFHLRDARASSLDLEDRLRSYASGASPAAGLMFSCTGRGRHLYGRPDHDTDLVRAHLGDVPLGGFFCAGEIGPVQGQTWLHGYTSSFGWFRPR